MILTTIIIIALWVIVALIQADKNSHDMREFVKATNEAHRRAHEFMAPYERKKRQAYNEFLASLEEADSRKSREPQ